jgi:diadenylate cyclase
VVSEETGIVSICHRGKIERNFDPESLKLRLGELFLYEDDEKSESEQVSGEGRFAAARERPLLSQSKEP